MSKRRKSSQPTPNPASEFAVRWHNIANPGTPSVDIMSSPDPLNDETTFLAPPSSQRVTRSSRSTRFASLGRSVSPRKQQFELEVGDNRSPQRLLVTVETEDEDAPATGTRRRLFPSSSPFKNGAGMAATTTTVPLKESIEDEFGDGSATTPKKRGRPRKTNGTPIPSAAKKRRAPTPLQRSTKRANTGRDVTSSLEPSQPTPTPKRRGRPPKSSVEPASDAGTQLEPTPEPTQMGTPTPKRRGRPPKNRSVEPSSDLGVGSQRTSTIKGRRRRQALAPEDLETMAEEPLPEPVVELPDANDDDAMDLVRAEVNSGRDVNAVPSQPRDRDSDIWMATMSDQATPRVATRKSRPEPEASPTPRIALDAPPASDDMESAGSLADGFAEGAPSVSDAGSIMDGPYHSASRRNDTVAQEDFSMIFMDSIQSYQELRNSVQGPQPEREKIGEETSHIIHNTLESLRQDTIIEGEDVQGAEPVLEDVVAENPVERDGDDMEERDDNLHDAGIDEMDLPEIPHVRVLPEDMGDDEVHHSPVPGTAGYYDQEDDEEQQMPEESIARRSDVSVHDPDAGQDDIDMVQQDVAEEMTWSQKEEVPADETMEEQPVPELDEARGSSSSPRQAEEPVEPDETEVIQTSSPVRSAGLSSKFGASPWLSRTPRRPNVSPLRRQVLSSVAKGDRTPRLSQKYRDSPLRDSPLRAAAASSQGADSPRNAQDESNMYEDSFSEIPEAILTAATPGRTAPIRFSRALENGNGEEDEEEQVDAPDATLDRRRKAPVSLSQALEEQGEEQKDAPDAAQQQDAPEADADPEANQHEGTEVAELDQAEEEEVAVVNEEDQQQQPLGYATSIHNQLPAPSNASSLAATDNGRLPTPDDTPPNIDTEDDQPDKSGQVSVASPTPDPQAQLASEQAAAPSSASRSSASQIPRISVERVAAAPEITPLNQMSSPVQEPPSSASQTSPGKVVRPALSAIVRAGRVLQNVTSDPPSPGDRQNQLGSPFRSSVTRDSWSGSKEPVNHRPSTSPGRRSTSHQRQSVSMDRLNDDPFASRPIIPRGQVSFLHTLDRNAGISTSKGGNSDPGSVAGSVTFKPQHEEMSWLPDAEPNEPEPVSDHSHQEIAHSSPSRQAANSARSDADRSDGPADRDDETDIWELEAQREEPESSRKETSFLSMTSAPLHRRPAIPSPWQRRFEFTQGSTSQFAASRTSSTVPNASQAQPEDDDEGYSLLAQRKKPQAEDDVEGYSLLAQRQKAQETGTAKQPESAAKPSGFDLSSFFSSPAAIGGRLAERFFPSKTTKKDEPEKAAAPAIPHSTMFPSAPPRQLDPSSEGPNAFSSPVRHQGPQHTQPSSERSEAESQSQPSAGQADAAEEAEAEEPQPPSHRSTLNTSASPATPERLERPLTSQTKDFTPRPRQTNQPFSQPSSARSAALTPPRMQLSHEDIERWQQETSNPSGDEGESPRRFLRPLPPRNASPSKSAIRSPLKPHTPGRVVEFTSSVLSPLEQARQRQQRHVVRYDEEEDDDEMSQPTPRSGMDKENDGEDVSMDDRPEAAQIKANDLSRTVWSRNHWLFLDRLLQHRKNQRFGIECEPRSQRLLGKTIRAHGESLKLEQWHLDCVDAFKALVGGWDEDVLCKRLFGLIKSEQRRARQLASGDAEMFH